MDNKIKNETVYIGISIASIIFLPITIAFLLAKSMMVIFTKNKKKIWLMLMPVVYGGVWAIVAVALNAFSSNDLSWYDYIVPVAPEIKTIIKAIDGVNIANNVILTLLASTLLSFLIFGVLALTRRSVIKSWSEKIVRYEKKLASEELVRDPRKNPTAGESITLFMYSFSSRVASKNEGDSDDKVMLNKKWGIPRKNLDRHLAIMGTTGSGKTATLYKFLYDAALHEKGIVFVDGKGDGQDLFKIKKLAKITDRKFYVFTLDGKRIASGDQEIIPIKYNPFSIKDRSITTDAIMALFDFSEEHYKAATRAFFDILIENLIELEINVSWESILANLNIDKITYLLKKRYKIGKFAEDYVPLAKEEDEIEINSAKRVQTIEQKANQRRYEIAIGLIKNVDERGVTGFSSRIGMLYNTTKDTVTEDGKTLKEVFNEGAIIYFSLNSTNYQEQARGIGKMIVNDIKAHAEINNELDKKTVIALDEFNVFAGDNVIDILNKGRSKGYEVILAFQSIADLDRVSKEFKSQVIENTNNKILQTTNDPDGAEYMASVMGTAKAEKKTYALEDEDTTGRESARVVDQYIAHPNAIKILPRGHAFVKYLDESYQGFTIPEEIKIDIPQLILDL